MSSIQQSFNRGYLAVQCVLEKYAADADAGKSDDTKKQKKPYKSVGDRIMQPFGILTGIGGGIAGIHDGYYNSKNIVERLTRRSLAESFQPADQPANKFKRALHNLGITAGNKLTKSPALAKAAPIAGALGAGALGGTVFGAIPYNSGALFDKLFTKTKKSKKD